SRNRVRRFGGEWFASRRTCDTEYLEALPDQAKYILLCGSDFSSTELCSERAEQQQTSGHIPTNTERPSERSPTMNRLHAFGLGRVWYVLLPTLHQMMADLLYNARGSLEK